jgi:hypothetical protein
MRFLKRFIKKIIRLIRWIPTLYRWEPWDYAYTYELMELVFQDLQNFYDNPKNVHIIDQSRLRIAKELLIAKNILKRLREDDYNDFEYKSLKQPEWISHPSPNGNFSRIEFKYDSEEHEKNYRKITDRYFKRKEQLIKQDLEYFGKIFKKSLRACSKFFN